MKNWQSPHNKIFKTIKNKKNQKWWEIGGVCENLLEQNNVEKRTEAGDLSIYVA
jgi:hypothetical protein